MKRSILIAIALFAGLSFAIAQDQNTNKPAPKSESSLEWLNPVADLGEIPRGIPATATYEFINNGDRPVRITNVRTSCGCTSKKYTKEPVKPGEKGEVLATYNAASLGTFQKTITVTTNEGSQRKVLRIKGKVVNKTDEAKK
ncbi:uncharacterized protein DUF1573 [Balneicella halophila]|uniref:Uncharacterized protein DUF1573 n=1 Tax=Balneicella halophila TaxID=1537566 RepID=A0A7L4UQ00_BALHA|nr:DUF1573 domain-containing protein [Balneicella halophila]PVX51830.1 uncharacterized protein DUF1573 [Balneicella halophila]